MFCPNCRAEYRPGFTQCSVCEVELISELPSEPSRDGEKLWSVWKGRDEGECVSLCRELMDAGIRYEVSQRPVSHGTRMVVSFKYQIAVLVSEYEKAREVLGFKRNDAKEDEQIESADSDTPLKLTIDDASKPNYSGEEVRTKAYLKSWSPESATSEVWTRRAADSSSVVELSLRENLIHFRSEFQEDGACKIFVRPEDEPAAREIIREIVEGAPPA
jgi:hypothetical protein